MPGPFPLRQAAALLPRGDLPLPAGALPPGSAPVIAVGVQSRDPSHAVLVEMRRDGGPWRFLRVLAETTPIEEGVQWFRASLPTLEAGRGLDYRVQLVRAGQVLATLPADGSWLTVTGDRPSANAPSATEVPDPTSDLEFFATLTATGRLEIIGETPEGYRINFFVESGEAVGPRIDAMVRRHGSDWLCFRRDGIGKLDARMTWETADGALILYRAGGVLDLGPDGYAKLTAGQLTGCPPFCATPTFVTAHPRWQWLNRIQGFGSGHVVMEERLVRYDIYIPRVPDRVGDD